MNRGLWNASLFLLLMGLALLLAGVVLAAYRHQKEDWKGRATARVVELLLREEEGPFRSRYYPVLEYYAEGQLYKVVYPQGSYPCRFSPGQALPLCYNKENPSQYRLLPNGPERWLPGAFFGAGMVCLMAGILFFLRFALRG